VWICVGVCPRIDLWTHAGIDSIPHLLIVARRDRGWKDYPRVWFALRIASSIVSWSLYLSIILLLLCLIYWRIISSVWRIYTILFGASLLP
jgi:hypothetical protein